MTATKRPTETPADSDRIADLEQTVAELNAALRAKADKWSEDPVNGTFAMRAAERAARMANGTESVRGSHAGFKVQGPPVRHT